MDTTKSIIEMYKKQIEEDKKTENFDLPEGVNPHTFSSEMRESYQQKLEELRKDMGDNTNFTPPQNETNDVSDIMPDALQRFRDTYRKFTEDDLDTSTNGTKLVDVTVKVKKAYCPDCGEEIISKFPVMFNPYTGEKIARYDCKCGAKLNLECSYPRIIYYDNDGNEIKAFND